ncbi:hypothetical protein FZD47_10650 [Bacillus infantis]|uniref:Oligosaccharide flippase family protein n=1 Tax=Bacillus infantis TaxID=324767 RepID=A0A5D4SL32_9BACI|nr:hypothetical protein [Bacillus infantis]TYS63953.1 hypothetical protein FZD47_10650 [Bacillus infantis]
MRSAFRKYINFMSDVTLNIIASGVIAIVLQFGVYPLLNKGLNTALFGEVLVMMSIVNIVAVLLGNSLNNIRILYNKEYKAEKVTGDFSLILLCAGIVNLLIMSTIVFLLWPHHSFWGNILLIIISLLTMLRSYLIVDYRLALNYKRIAQHSLMYSAALLFSTLILFISDLWQLVFFIGETISLLFLAFTTQLIKEPIKISFKIKHTVKQYILLCISSLLGNILIYLDRFIIFSFLGAQKVTIFFVATMIGKLSSLILSPISGVVLTYLSNKEGKITLKVFWMLNVGILIFSSIASFFTLILSKLALSIFYPNLYDDALKILFIANFAVILLSSCSLTQTIILKYSRMNVQILIQLVYGLIYAIGGIVMINLAGLKGFCLAASLAALFKFFFILFAGTLTLSNDKRIKLHKNN